MNTKSETSSILYKNAKMYGYVMSTDLGQKFQILYSSRRGK